MENGQRSPVHEIVIALWRALHELGSSATTEQIERWGFSIHAALSAAGREFHNHEHVVDLIGEGDPLEVIAALYHDAVYIQVDQGPPRSMRTELAGLLAPELPSHRRASESDAQIESRVGWIVQPAAAGPVPPGAGRGPARDSPRDTRPDDASASAWCSRSGSHRRTTAARRRSE